MAKNLSIRTVEKPLEIKENRPGEKNILLSSNQKKLNYLSNSSNFEQINNSQNIRTYSNQRVKSQNWQSWEVKKIFSLYAQYGSEWKLIQTQFNDRSSNSIKNRFYTVVRTFLKNLFKQHSQIKHKLPHQIPSKTILRFYQGRQQFIKFKGFGKKLLKSIDYNLEQKQVRRVAEQYSVEIKTIYELIFNDLACNIKNIKKQTRKKNSPKSNMQTIETNQESNLMQKQKQESCSGKELIYLSNGNQMQYAEYNEEQMRVPTSFVFLPIAVQNPNMSTLYATGYQCYCIF